MLFADRQTFDNIWHGHARSAVEIDDQSRSTIMGSKKSEMSFVMISIQSDVRKRIRSRLMEKEKEKEKKGHMG